MLDISNNINNEQKIRSIKGITFFDENNKINLNTKQNIIKDLDTLSFYDYSLFDKQVYH